MYKVIFGISLLYLFSSCAPSRFVKPLEKNQQAVNLSLGGPLFEYSDMVIPMPLLTAAYGYGFDSTLTGFGAVNITSALYGNLQVELGVTKQLVKQNNYIPAVSITPVANLIYRDKDAFKFYPQLDLSAFWECNSNRNYVYTGISNWFELSGKKAHEQDQQNHWLVSPYIGHSFVRRKWDLILEVKVLAPNISYVSNVVDYRSPFGKNGAFGIYVGYTRKF